MLDRLLDLIIEFIGLFQVFFYVDDFEGAVVLRFGVYHRTLYKGPHWVLPLNMETVIGTNIRPEPMFIDTQSCHTKDGFIANYCVGLIWKVENPKKFLVDNEDSMTQIALIGAGLMRELVTMNTWKQCEPPEFMSAYTVTLNRLLRKLGARVTAAKLIDLASGRADRIWLDGVEIEICAT